MQVGRAPIIAFSGIDGGGKSTQIDLLMNFIKQCSYEPVYFWSRGGYTPLFKRMKALVRCLPGGNKLPSGNNTSRSEAFRKKWVRYLWITISLVDLILIYGLLIRWWQWRKRPVICDRYLWDTLIDFRLNFPQEAVECWLLWRVLSKVAPKPDLSLLLLVPVEESIRRSVIKGEPFRDGPEVLAQRLAYYQVMTKQEEFYMFDGRQPREDIFTKILEKLNEIGWPPSSEQRMDVDGSFNLPG